MMNEEGIGSVVAAPYAVTLTMCVAVQSNVLKEERNEFEERTYVPTCRPALLCGIHTSR